MTRSLKLSLKSIKRAENALLRKGLNKKSLYSEVPPLAAKQAITKFFKGEPVEITIFQSICERLDLPVDEVISLEDPLDIEALKESHRTLLLKKIDELNDKLETLEKKGAPQEKVEKLIRELEKQNRALLKGPNLPVGYSLSNRYKLIKSIGEGGFATVWQAKDRDLKRKEVAVKVLHNHIAADSLRLLDFLHSAKVMLSLDHANIVRVLKEEGYDEHGYYYFVMNFIDGKDLGQVIRDKDNYSTDEIIRIIGAISEALTHAHKKNIFHKDVKPENILIDKNGTAYLTDFDLVIRYSKTPSSNNRSASGALGSFIYASPEIMGDTLRVDARSDIYSLGMTVLFCLYKKDLPSQVFRGHLDFIDLLGSDPDAPKYDPELQECTPEIKCVLAKAIEFDRKDRFESIADFYGKLNTAWQERDEQFLEIRVENFHDLPNELKKLNRYWISKFTVTNTEFRRFKDNGGYTPEGIRNYWSSEGQEVWTAYVERRSHDHLWTADQNRREDVYIDRPQFWNDTKYNHPAQPVIGVMWYEAEAYCKWLTTKLQEENQEKWGNKVIRIPSEAQWKYAAIGTTDYLYPWGNNPPTDQYVNFGKDKSGTASTVGQFPLGKSLFSGCHDMSGNVWEWCRDPYDNRPEDIKHGAKAVRGGCCFDEEPEAISIESRQSRRAGYRHAAIGFRIVIESLS